MQYDRRVTKHRLVNIRARHGRLPCLVHCRNRKGELRRFFVRKCTKDDLPAIMALQEDVMLQLPREDIFVVTTEEEFRETLENDYCIAAFSGRRMVMFSNMILGRPTSRHLGFQLGYDEEQIARSVIYDTTFVAPDTRGFGLQRLAAWFTDREARSIGAAEAIATVSPMNPASCRNILANGFRVDSRREMYGGLDRLVMKKDF